MLVNTEDCCLTHTLMPEPGSTRELDPWMIDHLSTCEACLLRLAEQMLDARLDARLDAQAAESEPIVDDPDHDLGDDIALVLAGLGDAHTRSRVAQARREPAIDQRVVEVRAAMDDDRRAPRRPTPLAREAGVEPEDHPSAAPTGRRRAAWIAGAALLIASAAALWSMERAREGSEVRPLPMLAAASLNAFLHRGAEAGVGLIVRAGETVCPPLEESSAPCAWHAGRDTLQFEYWRDPVSPFDYALVVGLGAHGVSAFVSDGAGASRPLRVTAGWEGDWCNAGVCWLAGGRYEASPGRIEVLTIFSKAPVGLILPPPWVLDHLARLGAVSVQRHLLEVVP